MTTKPRRGRILGAVIGAVLTVALAAAAFVLLDVIIAAAVTVVLVTTFGIAVAASGWEQHSTYEEREQARALRRKEKWDRNEGARQRDREKWAAHQARQAARRTGTADGER